MNVSRFSVVKDLCGSRGVSKGVNALMSKKALQTETQE